MHKSTKRKKNKIPKITETQYADYVMSLKDSEPTKGYEEAWDESLFSDPTIKGSGKFSGRER
jgi:hypothetical protein